MTQQNNYPFVSIIVISRDRHKMLEDAIKSLLAVDYPFEKYEIVVVEEGDKLEPIPHTNYIFLPRKNLGLGYARNQGVKHSKGDIILFTDDDCIVDKNWVKNMVQTIISEKVGGVAGATLAQQGNIIGKCEEILGYPGGGLRRYLKSGGKVIPTKLLSGCNCAYDRKVFVTMKFEEKGFGALGGDDCILGIQVFEKYGCVYNPNAIVYHKPRGNLIRIIKWFERRRINEFLYEGNKRDKKNHYVFVKLWKQIVLYRILLIMILLLGGIATTVIAAILVLLYLIVLYFRHLPMIRFRKKYLVLLVLPFVKICMDIGILKAEIKYLLYPYRSLFGTLSEYTR